MPENVGCLGKSEHITWKKLGEDKSVLLDLNSGHYYTLNETATFVWELILEETSLPDIADRVSKAYDTGSADVEDDINEMVQTLLDKGLVSEVSVQ